MSDTKTCYDAHRIVQGDVPYYQQGAAMRNFKARLLPVLVVLVLTGVIGCGKKPQWEITVENQSPSPCGLQVEMSQPNGTSQAKIDSLESGKTVSLIVGEFDTKVDEILFTQGKSKETLKPGQVLSKGHKYHIVVDKSGKVAAGMK